MRFSKIVFIIRIALLGFFASISSTVFGQLNCGDVYSIDLFSEPTKNAIQKLESIQNKQETVRFVDGTSLRENKTRLLNNCTVSELFILVHHRDQHIRAIFLPDFVSKCNDRDTLIKYLNCAIDDTSTIVHFDGCMIFEESFGAFAYRLILQKCDFNLPFEIDLHIIQRKTQPYIAKEILLHLPHSDSNYTLLKSLVIEYDQYYALEKLLQYRDTNDRSLIYKFIADHRNECQELLLYYPPSSLTQYLYTTIPEALKNNWEENEYSSYIKLIDKQDSITRKEIYSSILNQLQPTNFYAIAPEIYNSEFYLFDLKENKAVYTLALLTSLQHIDSIDLNEAISFDPILTENALLHRLKNKTNPYDNESANAVFQFLNLQPTAKKDSVFLQICKTSSGAAVFEAIATLKQRYSSDIASILLERYRNKNDSVSFQWNEICDAIAFFDDYKLNVKIAPELVEKLIECNLIYDPFSILQIIKSANDPILYERLLTNIELKQINNCSIATIRFLLELNNKMYNTRLVNRYKKISQQEIEDNYYHEKFKDYLIFYSLLIN